MHQQWQLWTSSVPGNVCDDIIQYAKTLPQEVGSIGLENSGQNQIKDEVRVSTVSWIPYNANQSITDLLWSYAHQANRNAFQFDINFINDIQFTTYSGNVNGKYGWHHDVFWDQPKPFDRKISIVIQLSDPSEYEGGVFEFDPQLPQVSPELFLPRGSVLAFPSFFTHRVTPVTKGTRHSLVTWVEGPKFR